MIAWIFEFLNKDVGYLIAGKPKDFKKSARKGSEDIFILEADEYDTAFLIKDQNSFTISRYSDC